MNSPETHDPIDKLLREQDGHLPDDGFTRRVMAALPRRRRVYPRVILFVAVAIGIAMVVFWMPWKTLPPFDYTQIFNRDSNVLTAWLPFIIVGVALTSAVLNALRRED